MKSLTQFVHGGYITNERMGPLIEAQQTSWYPEFNAVVSTLFSFTLEHQCGILSAGYVEEPEQSADRPLELESRDGDSTDGAVMETTLAAVTTATLITNTNFTYFEEDADQHEFILMVLIPLILLALLFVILVILVTRYKRKRTKQEPSSQGSQNALQTCELGSENIKVPIFEEDTPSVMEIEMEELDKWMNNMNRNADCECLPTLKEEKESNHNSSDSES